MIHKTRKLEFEKDKLFVASFYLTEHPHTSLYDCRNDNSLKVLKQFCKDINTEVKEGQFSIVSSNDYDVNRKPYTQYNLFYENKNGNKCNIHHYSFTSSQLEIVFSEFKKLWCTTIIDKIAAQHFSEVASKYVAFESKNNISFSTNLFETNYDYILL